MWFVQGFSKVRNAARAGANCNLTPGPSPFWSGQKGATFVGHVSDVTQMLFSRMERGRG